MIDKLCYFGNNCNETCDGCISELCNSSDGVCDIEDICKAGWYGVKCDKGKMSKDKNVRRVLEYENFTRVCIILYKY